MTAEYDRYWNRLNLIGQGGPSGSLIHDLERERDAMLETPPGNAREAREMASFLKNYVMTGEKHKAVRVATTFKRGVTGMDGVLWDRMRHEAQTVLDATLQGERVAALHSLSVLSTGLDVLADEETRQEQGELEQIARGTA